MKAKQIHEELNNLAKEMGIKIRREAGKFRSGWCVVNDNKLILVNRTTPAETVAVVIARCLAQHDLENHFVKPAVRDFIENERANIETEPDFNLEVKY